jgi:2-succinyl-6-hydroxy-2,4-cyclohexadiene-1-carboxylate synthase
MIRSLQMTPTVLLLHGFTHTGSSWEPVVAALGERYRSLTPDLRGHGSASDLVPVTLEAVLGDLDALVGPGSVTLVGYSMGGRIALHFALARPEAVARLVLVGASPGLADPREREERRRADAQLAEEIERLGIEEFARRWARTPVLAGLPAQARERAYADRLRNTPAALARALRGLGTGTLPSLWDRLGELRMPVLLLAGESDEKFREIAERMAQSIPSAGTGVVAGAGHAVHLEAPAMVAEFIQFRGSVS